MAIANEIIEQEVRRMADVRKPRTRVQLNDLETMRQSFSPAPSLDEIVAAIRSLDIPEVGMIQRVDLSQWRKLPSDQVPDLYRDAFKRALILIAERYKKQADEL